MEKKNIKEVEEKIEKIEVEVKEIDNKVLFLSQDLGSGTFGIDTKFVAMFSLPNYSLIVKVGEKRYKVNSQEIIKKVLEFHERKKVVNKKS